MPSLVKCELTPNVQPATPRSRHKGKLVYWFGMVGGTVWSTDPELHTKSDRGYVIEESGRIHLLGQP